jgi:ADP-ribosylglycohydrolase
MMSLNLDLEKNQKSVERFFDKLQKLPVKKGYKYREPSDLAGILKLCDKPAKKLNLDLSEGRLRDKVLGAWLGRCAGCLLGKPVEGWHRQRLADYLKETGQYPLNDYIHLTKSEEIIKKYEVNKTVCFIDNVDCMPEDDDTNYTVTGLAIIKQYGQNFAARNVAEFWMGNIPILHVCTAERVAYKNFVDNIWPPESGNHLNPYREMIGAQIRADFWGYVNPGNIEKAAEFAYRDACISHVKNGIYGEMWVAAMLAAAYVQSDMKQVIKSGLSCIPKTSRLYESITQVIKWYESGENVVTAIDEIHKIWNEKMFYGWCHTISNAMIVAAALLYGEKDFGKTVSIAVSSAFDTDCNGATSGSVIGTVLGAAQLPDKWVKPLNNKLYTGVAGYHVTEISKLADDTIKLIA